MTEAAEKEPEATETPPLPNLTSEKSLANTAKNGTSENSSSDVEGPEVRKVEPVTVSRMALEVEVNTVHRFNVKPGITPQDTLEQDFWCHVSMHLIPGDTLVVVPDDGRWKQILHVINCGPQFAHVQELHLYELAKRGEIALT